MDRRIIRLAGGVFILSVNFIPVSGAAQNLTVTAYPRAVHSSEAPVAAPPPTRATAAADNTTLNTDILKARYGDSLTFGVLRAEVNQRVPSEAPVAEASAAADTIKFNTDALQQAYGSTFRFGAIRAEVNRRAPNGNARTRFLNWNMLSDETAAAQFWGTTPVTVLPSASVSPGAKNTTLFTELASALSGGWRFALATALAVTTNKGTQESATDSAAGKTDVGFRRFLAGGGNLSLSGSRPIGLANRGSGTHLLFFTPRAWTNIPSLSDAETVTDFGGELAIEYQYQRYERKWNNGTLGERAATPFLTFHTRFGTAAGTNGFYRTIGRPHRGIFPYTVPSLDLNFANGAKVGVSYFYGFGSLKQHEGLQVNIILAPDRTAKKDSASATH